MPEPKKIPILSLKGGTGKTTTCLGVARALQRLGYKVGLLDVDIHASALPKALGLKVDPGYDAILGGKLRPVNFEGFQIFSIGLLFPEDAPNMWPGDTKASAVKQIATTAIAWDNDLQWVVVDTPPTSGDEVQSLLANLPEIYGAVIICQPNDLALLAIVKTLNVLRSTQTPIAGIVSNMSGYKCPNCGVVSNPFDRQTEDIQAIASKVDVRFLGNIPFAPQTERDTIMTAIVDQVLKYRPVILKEDKGGLSRWLLNKFLT